MNEYLVLPECDDTNRGDQALIWETVNLAREAGFRGMYYMLASADTSRQSEKIGIGHISPILLHPSAHFKKNDNIRYTKTLKLKWGVAALFNIIYALPLLSCQLRRVLLPFYNEKIKDTLSHYDKSSASFVKGGGFLHAYGGFSESYKIFYFLYHIKLAMSYGHDIYVMPNSFGPFNAPFVKRMIRNTLSKCKIVTTRESISQKVLKEECNIVANNLPDLAFYLRVDNLNEVKKKLIKRGIPLGRKICVSITVRPYRFPGESNGEQLYRKYVIGVRKFIKWLYENDYYPVLVEHVSSELVHESDMQAIKDIIKELPDNNKWGVFSDVNLNCKEMKALYSCFDYTVGTRFHSVIFSLSEEVPSIAITYGGNKGEGIMRDIGMNQYAIKMRCVNKDILIAKFQEIVKDRDIIIKKLRSIHTDMDNQRNELLQKISIMALEKQK